MCLLKKALLMKRSCEKLKSLAILTPLIFIVFGCSMHHVDSNVTNDYAIPDYHKSESKYVPLDFFTMTSDFINDHKNKYIVFEGYYSGIIPDPPLDYKGRKRVIKDMQSFYVREKKHSHQYVRVVCPDIHEEDVRAIIPLNRHRSRLKVFAYVLPPGEHAVLKNGKLFRSFDETLIWLINVVVTFDDGIHYRGQ